MVNKEEKLGDELMEGAVRWDGLSVLAILHRYRLHVRRVWIYWILESQVDVQQSQYQ